ncbi:uncharacterized protein LOC114522108 [Dendronephthya gigantea]|uniref:uncharacterized protein LOC114522108 n=1 Tax=Dendronephthya gigantea TaxID=151771 RepID=UPI00106CC948|nr:uncharacterized protein LOC114522108 [Dendronephthya gigantea]
MRDVLGRSCTTEHTATKGSTDLTEEKMATQNVRNVFASPWNDSDTVLDVENQELHVHKWILISQSPVFKAMLDGHFKEANQDKITLKGKNVETMVQFLKTLYPSSMFREAKTPMNDEIRLSIMALAEEYQCVDVIKQCIDEMKITPENALQILPYVVKYYQTVLPQLYDIINWSASAAVLETVLPNIEGQKGTSDRMLLTKCRFLEDILVKMESATKALLCDFLRQRKKLDDMEKSLKDSKNKVSTYYSSIHRDTTFETTADSRCPHSVAFGQIKKTKGCLHCKEKYKEKFFALIPSCPGTQHYFDMFEKVNDVVTAVNEQKRIPYSTF